MDSQYARDAAAAKAVGSGRRPAGMVAQNRSPSGRRVGVERWATWPGVALSLLLFALPLIAMIVVSFWTSVYGKLMPLWTLANYEKFVGTPYLREALFNSIEVTVISTALSVVLAYPLAYFLAYNVPSRWQRLLLLLAVLPFWTAYVVRSYSWLLVLSENGVLNQLLISFGLLDDPLQLAYTRGATVLGFVHFFTMLLTLTIYANLVQINPSYVRAAHDLGASKLQAFLRITLPLSIPGIAVGAFIAFVITIGDYITPQILGGNTEVLVPQAIMLQVGRAANLPMAAVMSIFLMLIILFVYFISARHLKMERI